MDYQILSNCRSGNDKIRPKITKIHCLTARVRFGEALCLGFDILSNLGEKITSRLSLFRLILEIIKVKNLLRKKSDEDLLNLPAIENPRKETAIEVCNILLSTAICCSPDHYAFLVLRSMSLTLKFGHSNDSPITFATYGMVLCALGEREEAYRFGQLSLQLMDRSESANRKWFPRASFLVHAAINPWSVPGRIAVKEGPRIISEALEICDHECSVYSAYSFCMNDYQAGTSIGIIEERLEQYMEFIKRFQQGPWLTLSLLLRQFLLNLMGKTQDPLLLDISRGGEGQDLICPTSEDKFSFQLQESTLVTHKLQLAYHFEFVSSCQETQNSFTS